MDVEGPGSVPAADASELVRRTADRSAALARLAAGVAHELRNPFSVILARAQLLALGLRQGRAPDPDKIESVLSTIEEQALRAARLRDRVEAGGVAVEVAVEQGPVALVADRDQLTTALAQVTAIEAAVGAARKTLRVG